VPDPLPLKYRAFISYSHADTGWAKWLQRGLEGFKIDKDLAGRETPRGAIPASLRPIFRDREDFTAGEALPEQTLAALDASAALIVVCSPDSARSNYVNEETRLFKSRHQDRPVIPLIVGGKPGDPERECFPSALKFKLDGKGRVTKRKAELLAADAREDGDGKNLALAKVVAGMIGLSSDEIFRRAERERRAAARRRRRVQALIGALGVLLIVGLVGWINQDYLREQYCWHVTMRPRVLTAEQERALKPKDEFAECVDGCPNMVVVPAGAFVMGSPDSLGQIGETPQHGVTIAQPFALGKYEVTFAEWDACVAAGACPLVPDNQWGRGDQPVINVSRNDAERYTAWLSKLTGKPYRLPTEAEWEYAARAGTATLYFFGDDPAQLGDYAWYAKNTRIKTLPVGKKRPNPFGLYDIYGNVLEVVADPYHPGYLHAPNDGSIYPGDEAAKKQAVSRGGSWYLNAESVRSAARFPVPADYRENGSGFRIARSLDQ
jgi:formylglycine-generating enzyme required for sulfatase activity